ncbi:LysR family transcriptional regulator [Chelativorans sp. AA-79]|uniref:LysR family transcriptional regulator n=1 Tax=Chelativorans sp. AA-79 TaxID=3028735 RepID=UPI0023F65E4F|nr:LysR family transcriptional regulator [Chelativorans sp. AA-79]WEX08675.1 LysR family transcriptional regulator [Chelativorans sp. AA-79]
MDRNLRAFLAVAREGNLTSAADKIGLTQPALTKTIRRLEQECGSILFERTARGMLLTTAGKMLLERSRAIEMHYQQAHEEIRLLNRGALREFRIAAGSAYHAAIAPDLVKRLSTEFPATRFVLAFEVAGNALPKLVDGDLDLLLGAFLSVPTEGIETHPLLKVEITAYACRKSALANSGRVTATDLGGREWVIYQRDTLMTGRLRSFCADHILPEPRIVMEIDSLLASFRVVSGTEYLTAASTLVRELAEDEGLVMLRLEAPIWRFASGAWFRSSLRNYSIMQRALEILKELTAPYT